MNGWRLISMKKLERLIEERAREKCALIESKHKRDELKKQADIATLQAQINPHFLYNALECIRGQALLSDVPVIADIAQALSGYFRYNISLREDVVSLREEIANVRNYVHIQKFRFDNRFDLKIDADESDVELMNSALPKLTLQPLVENSIHHGFSVLTRENAVICISIKATDEHVNIHVIDNGAGISWPTLNKLNEELDSGVSITEKRDHGIALINVHLRLKLLFGSQYGLTLSSVENSGTDIEIHIPRRTVEGMRVEICSNEQ